MLEGYLLILIFTTLGALGGFLIRRTMIRVTDFKSAFHARGFYLGILFYASGAIVSIFALQLLPYIVVLPSSSLTYVWGMMIAAGILKERINIVKIIGMGFIVVGTVMVALNAI